MSDALRVAREKNYVYGLIEVDVTEARRRIHEYEARTGGSFSFCFPRSAASRGRWTRTGAFRRCARTSS
ncbi:MAG: hypothetical protein U0703_07305 [Anaerolineae bacterium]